MKRPSIFVFALLLTASGWLSLSATSPSCAETFAQKHPRRAEVNRRRNNLNRRINGHYGHLGGHYGQLKAEDRGIHAQERAEVKANGGHLTKAEKQQLNREENQLNRQIKHDRTK